MSKSRGFFSILIPGITVFISSGCIMVLELVAGRIIARHLGASLYTWTAVIGVVLAGITIGNFLGGRIADRLPARKALSILLGISSVICVIVIMLNDTVGEWLWLWKLSWPAHIFTQVALVFILPSILLGTISPVIAKMALDKGLPTGRTVGDIYACGAAGSIIGTFLTGFYLIAALGTITIIWMVAAVLLLMAILYWARLWVLYIWAVIFIILMTMGIAPAKWAESAGLAFGVRIPVDPSILYETESQYSYIAVQQLSKEPDSRIFLEDKLIHSEIIMNDVMNLPYFYSKVYDGLTEGLTKDKISVMVIGGGGYAYPQYLEKRWPGSHIDVVEIDPAVTEAAIKAFGLSRNSSINTITMDARNYVDELLNKQHNGEEIPRYNFIYEDAFNDYSVPFQLVTREFNDKIAKILTDDGVYMINVIDIFDSGRFLGALINTLEKTFPYVYVIGEYAVLPSNRDTYVIVAAKYYFEPESILSRYNKILKLRYLSKSDINYLKERSGGVVLTDDYVPVENMLAPVVRESAKAELATQYVKQARSFEKQAKWSQSIAMYEKAVQICPAMSAVLYNEMGTIQSMQGRYEEGILYFKKAVSVNPEDLFARENICLALLSMDKLDEAISCYTEALQERNDWPNIDEMYSGLGMTYEQKGNLALAEINYKKALTIKPDYEPTLTNLGNVLLRQGKFEEAIQNLNKTIELNPNRVEALNNLSRLLVTVGEISIQEANRAIELAERACELTGYKEPAMLDTLAAAFAVAGRFDDAVTTAQQAIDVAKASGQEDLCGEIQRRLELYKAGQPYTEPLPK
jgi:tetratricopeptide (TPR) repeat protein/MFS family permease